MHWSNKIDLGNWVETIIDGEPIRTVAWTTVWANKLSVRQSEYYAAENAGLKPEITFKIRLEDYDNQELIRFPSGDSGKTFTLIRQYEKGNVIELICSAKVGEMNG